MAGAWIGPMPFAARGASDRGVAFTTVPHLYFLAQSRMRKPKSAKMPSSLHNTSSAAPCLRHICDMRCPSRGSAGPALAKAIASIGA